jgi:hypothetical protein
VLLCGGCLLDLYGGQPRLRIRNTTASDTVEIVGVGDTALPGWTCAFDPAVAPGKSSSTVDLPVGGDLNLFLRVRHADGQDTVVLHGVSVGAGDYVELDVADGAAGGIAVH